MILLNTRLIFLSVSTCGSLMLKVLVYVCWAQDNLSAHVACFSEQMTFKTFIQR